MEYCDYSGSSKASAIVFLLKIMQYECTVESSKMHLIKKKSGLKMQSSCTEILHLDSIDITVK